MVNNCHEEFLVWQIYLTCIVGNPQVDFAQLFGSFWDIFQSQMLQISALTRWCSRELWKVDKHTITIRYKYDLLKKWCLLTTYTAFFVEHHRIPSYSLYDLWCHRHPNVLVFFFVNRAMKKKRPWLFKGILSMYVGGEILHSFHGIFWIHHYLIRNPVIKQPVFHGKS